MGVAALQLIKDNEERGAKVLPSAIGYPAGVGDETGASGDALYPVRRICSDDQSGCRFKHSDIIKLGTFVVASYIAILLMFVVHGLDCRRCRYQSAAFLP